MNNILEKTRIVLIGTSHPGNIGSAARAMKTMGLDDLYLVAPHKFPDPKADELAAGAADLVARATVVQTLEEAIADCTLVIGTSARMRAIPWPLLTPREMVEKVKTEQPDGQIAVLFGREHSGLTNEELERCHFHINIPANPDYSSLNLAMAVQVVAYELRMASLQPDIYAETWDYRLANADEMEKFFRHLETVLVDIDFLKPSAPRKLMTRLRRMFLRTRPDVMEMNMLRGMLTAIQDKLENK